MDSTGPSPGTPKGVPVWLRYPIFPLGPRNRNCTRDRPLTRLSGENFKTSRGQIVDQEYLNVVRSSSIFSGWSRILYCIVEADLHTSDGKDLALSMRALENSVRIATDWDNLEAVTVYAIIEPAIMWAISVFIAVIFSTVALRLDYEGAKAYTGLRWEETCWATRSGAQNVVETGLTATSVLAPYSPYAFYRGSSPSDVGEG
ncbi:hypothetical protein TWF106_006876 [Orbilia oligospora]|uniref:Uncharacterized protein n=1 Tax=Orbilia oligospora TaxID=2813651 RepID=A0A7C8UZY6_ORBOL|nr:hypothetical protein TWF106_006876 [Orbilia oligospora]